jgi:NAD(P)-dependent dehydrogenase (short-subunit alcohol dehydrogenase family)|tara:strand:- start:533 stop:1291 length:759 start_codon:yes stop_codon:yes gene_type:complete
MKKKVELAIIGGSGLIGNAIINKFLSKNKTVLNLDIINKLDKNNNYFFKKFDMTTNKLKNNLENIFKIYTYPRVFIDCSYIDRIYFKNASIEKISKNQLDLILKKWLSSTVVISSYILKNMKKNKIKGNVILTSSIYGIVAQDLNVYKRTKITDNIAYALVKSGINNFVKNAAVKFGEFNIRVNSVCPGGVYSSKDKNFKNKVFTKNYLSKVPLKRFATSADLANAYFFLASDESSYITGINLLVDGGYTLI